VGCGALAILACLSKFFHVNHAEEERGVDKNDKFVCMFLKGMGKGFEGRKDTLIFNSSTCWNLDGMNFTYIKKN
jgi:hypothetical protein